MGQCAMRLKAEPAGAMRTLADARPPPMMRP